MNALKKRFTCLVVTLIFVISSFAFAVSQKNNSLFVTWDSLEPDKWASVWLIKNHIDPNATLEIMPVGHVFKKGVSFGMPQAMFNRSAQYSTFEALLSGFQQQDKTLIQIGSIITAIETTAWNVANDPLVASVERHFRHLQDRYDRAFVPVNCYGHFFNVLYDQLAQAENDFQSANITKLDLALKNAVQQQDCNADLNVDRLSENRVQELELPNLLDEIAAGDKVIFIDTREPAEFAKSHIPGALNLPMRDTNATAFEQLKSADRIISYCVKDFRGYEVAKQMLDAGLTQVAVMKPHGLSGWQASGLPLASKDVSENQAQKQLLKCAKEQTSCIK